MEEAYKKRNRLLLVKHTHIHKSCNTRPFSKTHSLMLATEGVKKETNRLLLVKHTEHKTILVKLTSWCWRWRNHIKSEIGYFWSSIHTYTTQDHLVKLTIWCWRWRKHTRREKGYIFNTYTHTHTTQDHSVKLTRWCWQWKEQTRRETGYFWSSIHNTRPFSKTHKLMLAMEIADKERNRLLLFIIIIIIIIIISNFTTTE